MEFDLKAVTANYRERMQRIALWEPLFNLEKKRTTDGSNQPIDYFSLGLLTLLFFFENMLMRNKNTGARELAGFLAEVNHREIDLDMAGFEKLARDIIEVFRPSSGKRNSRTYYNWDTRQEEMVYYSILKADRFDAKSNAQYYTLDEQGLELVFATREYYSEFQISINQLLLRKQLEKGEFAGALRQVDEMRVAVESLKERMVKIKHEVQRNIVSDRTYQRYREIIEDINARLSREDEEFEELQSFVRDTRERLGYEKQEGKVRQAYELIVRIDRELGEVHYQHRQLLQDSIDLKTTTLQAAQEALYYAGIDSFNFQKEITDRLFSSPLPFMSSRQLAEPLLYLERVENWSPLAVFFKQRVENRGEREITGNFLELSADKGPPPEMELMRRNFRRIMELILEIMGDRTRISLSEVMIGLERNDHRQLLEYRVFYYFWIVLHQRSPLLIDSEEEGKNELFGEVVDLLKPRAAALVVTEKNQVLSVMERYSIKDMELELEGLEDAV